MDANSDTLFNESKEKILALFDDVFLDIVFGRGSLLKASESEIKSVFSSYEDVGVKGIGSSSACEVKLPAS